MQSDPPCDAEALVARWAADPQARLADPDPSCTDQVRAWCRAALATPGAHGTPTLEACVLLLVDARSDADAALLAPLLAHPEPRLRSAAAVALSGQPHPNPGPWLQHALRTEQDPAQRVLLAKLCTATGDPAVIRLLDETLGALPAADRALATPYGTLDAALAKARTR